MQDEGDENAFLSVQISQDTVKKTITFTQPNLIQQIMSDVGLMTSINGKDTPRDFVLYADTSGHAHIEN